MRFRFGIFVLVALPLMADAPKNVEPRITSIYPLVGQRGQTYEAVICGINLSDAKSLFFRDGRMQGRVLRIEEEGEPTAGPNRIQRVHAEITIGRDAAIGINKLRVVTATGTSNETVLRVAEEQIAIEPQSDIDRYPSVIAGRIYEPGEADDYWVNVKAGQSLIFEAISGNDLLDPAITLYEASGSWFDPKRLNRLAFNDEPLTFPGMTRNAMLSYRFSQAGRYCLRIQGFAGQGGPDGVYELRITEGTLPSQESRPALRADWEEHELTRSLGDNWMQRVASRGSGIAPSLPQPETYRAVSADAAEIPTMKIPGMVEGFIAKPGELHAIKLVVDKAQEIAIEVETPKATTPIFTPIVRLLEPGGNEIVANIYTRLNNNNFQMMKSIKAKAAFALAAPGTYTLQIRELTTDHAGQDFQYRVMVRPQIPHIGKFVVQQERINLEPGSTKPVSVRIEREEGFSGTVAVQVENLPAGVSALTGVENPAERPALPNAGKPERYQPRTQATSVVLTAAKDAPASISPAPIRVVARPVRDGQLGEPVASAEILLTVIAKK